MTIARPARRRRQALALGATVFAMSGALTGCTGLQPGAAVRVGDTTISMAHVDEVAEGFCAAIEPQLGQGGLPAVLSMGDLRSGVAQQLASRRIAEQIAEDFDVAPTSDYTTAVKTLQAQADSLPAGGRDAFLEVQTASTYIQNVVAAAARQDLIDSGTSAPTQAEISAHSDELFKQYLAAGDLAFDPRLGLASNFDKQDGTLSVAVSALATQGADAASLPESQRCGG